ncbi:MAG: hypothetical protein H0V30_05775 [Chitinophagaceae bacterium]|jgi:hypothetical protein|nr:hypothetical protein [Chitinophagaceae bacterium]
MNLNFQYLLPIDYSPESRVWIYQSSRLFSLPEALEIEKIIDDFIATWKSHGVPVKGFGTLIFGQFILLMADESATSVGGCSTDSSVHVIKEIEMHFQVNLFERTMLAFVVKDKVELLPLSQLKYAFDNGFIDANTFYFNNVVLTKRELENNWIIPVKDSWLKNKLQVSLK